MTDTRAGEWVPQVPLAERVKAVEPDVRDAIVAAERARIRAAVERLSLLDAPGMWVEFDAVIAIIDGESDDA